MTPPSLKWRRHEHLRTEQGVAFHPARGVHPPQRQTVVGVAIRKVEKQIPLGRPNQFHRPIPIQIGEQVHVARIDRDLKKQRGWARWPPTAGSDAKAPPTCSTVGSTTGARPRPTVAQPAGKERTLLRCRGRIRSLWANQAAPSLIHIVMLDHSWSGRYLDHQQVHIAVAVAIG